MLFGVFLYTIARTTIILHKGFISVVIPIDPEWLEYMMIGLVIIVVVLFRPQGLIPKRPTPALPTKT